MKSFLRCLLVAACLVPFSRLGASETGTLAAELEPMRPLLGKTWRGEFKNSTPEKPVADVMRGERALNGQAIRSLHSVNDGAYGGETIYRWDADKKSVVYHYFTTAGFMTTGTITFKDGKFVTHEVVSNDTGGAGGVKEVRATSELLPGGIFRVKTEHLKDGEWKPARETDYKEDASARVVFK